MSFIKDCVRQKLGIQLEEPTTAEKTNDLRYLFNAPSSFLCHLSCSNLVSMAFLFTLLKLPNKQIDLIKDELIIFKSNRSTLKPLTFLTLSRKTDSGLFADGVSAGTESHFVMQDGAQVLILAYCLHIYLIDKSVGRNCRVSAKVDKHLWCLSGIELHI